MVSDEKQISKVTGNEQCQVQIELARRGLAHREGKKLASLNRLKSAPYLTLQFAFHNIK